MEAEKDRERSDDALHGLHKEMGEANQPDPSRAFRTFDPLVLELAVTV